MKTILFTLIFCSLICYKSSAQVGAGTISGSQTICSGGDPAAFTETSVATGNSLAYQWQSSLNNSTWSDIAGATNTIFDVPSGLTATTYYRRKVSGSGTPSVDYSNVLSVTINSVNGGGIGNTQTVCSGAVPATFTTTSAASGTALTYQWQSAPSGSPYADIPGATGATYTASQLYTNTNFRRYAISTLNGVPCSVVSNNSLTVFVSNGGLIGGSGTVCSGTAPSYAFTSQGAASGVVSSYQWQSSTDNINYSDIPGATSATYQATTITQTTYYRRQGTSTLNTVTCTNPTSPVILTVNQQNAGTIGNDQTICSGGDPALFQELTSATGTTLSYQWQKATVNNSANFADIGGATGNTYDPPSNLTQTTYYRRKFTSTQSGLTCSVYSNVVTANVNFVSAGVLGGNQAVCSGGNPVAITETTPASGAAMSYQWQSSLNNSTFSNISGATGVSYTPPGGATQTVYYKRSAISTLNSVLCSALSNTVTVTLNAVTGGTINGNQISCYGGIPTTFGNVAVGTGTSITYQWQKSTDNVNFTTIPGANLTTYNPNTTPTVVITTTYFRRLATSTISGTACSAPSNSVVVTLNEPGVIGTNQAICRGGTPAPFTVITAATGSSITYQWQKSSTGANFTDIAGATSTTYQPPAAPTVNMYYRRIAKSILANGNPCLGYSNVVSVVINDVNPGVTEGDRTVCVLGDPAPFTVVTPANGSGVLSYKWQSSSDNITYADLPGATAATYDVPAGISRTAYFRRITTSTLLGTSCDAIGRAFAVATNSGGQVSGNTTICSGIAPAAFPSLIATSGINTSYQWQKSFDGVNYSVIPGATQATYNPGAGITQTTYFRRMGTGTLNGITCTNPSNVVLVSVLQVNAGSIAGDQTICAGITPSNVTDAAPATGGILSYLWQKSTDGVNYAPIWGATDASYSIPSALYATTMYKRNVTATLNGSSCTASTNVVTKTVNWNSAGTIGSNSAVCNNTIPPPFTELTPAQAASSIAYQWSRSTDGVTFNDIAGATASGYSEPNALTKTSWYKRQVTSTVNGLNCTAYSNIVSVSINNVTPGSITGDYGICPGGSPLTFGSSQSGTGPSIWYDWQSSTDGVNFTNVGAHFATYLAPAGTIFQQTYFRRLATTTLLGSTCQAASNVLTLFVNNVSAGTIGSSQLIANGAVPAPFTEVAAASGNALTYQWAYSTNGTSYNYIAGATSPTYARTTGVTTNTTFKRIVTGTQYGIACSANSNIVTISVPTVRPAFVGNEAKGVKQVKDELSSVSGDYKVFPNPVVNHTFNVDLQGSEAGKYRLRVISQNGQMLYEQLATISAAGRNVVNITLPASVAAGLYNVEITSPNNSRTIKSIVVEK